MRLDAELLDGPPHEAARVVALARVADAEEAAARLDDPSNPEALHDFRVAVRRLRSTLRALAPALGSSLRARPLRRLRQVARATGPARDAEVLLAWLRSSREALAAPHRGALDWLVDRVERLRALGDDDVKRYAAPRLLDVAPRLARRLSERPEAGEQALLPTFARFVAARLRAQTVALRQALLDVAGPADQAGIHRARIEGKRLRYLLEPLRGAGLKAGVAVETLKALQDLLGEWHDAQVAALALEQALVVARADEARHRGAGRELGALRPGLLALARLVEQRAAGTYRRLEAAYLDGRATPLLDAAYAVVGALEAREQEAPVGPPERRFLLTGLPPEAADGDEEELEQGWLPGERSRESVGVTRSPLGEQPFLVRGPGAAPRPLSRAELEAWWPLTEGRRVHKRSRLVPGLPGWRFETFLDRTLFLAVAEAGAEEPAPGWLEPVLVREVTGERGYADEALARRPPRRHDRAEQDPAGRGPD
jgi:CHAD domain-containing protein